MTHPEHWKISDHIKSLDPIISGLFKGTSSKWAILLCKFADDTLATTPRAHYERLFTGTGSGSLNMPDFFADMSHGQLDLTASQVFGWYTLTQSTTDYKGTVDTPPTIDRNGLFAACRQKAIDAGVNLAAFDGVVVSMNGAVDLFGYVGGMAAFCDSNSLQPSLLGQEMGHGYGLDHARRDGSTDDYQDPWDVMSTANAYMGANAEWTAVGPGLCASAMRERGWLDEARVWTSSSPGFDSTIDLRPLHRHDLAGVLAAEVGPYLVELRVRERWDAGVPYAAVLVHHMRDNHSYLSGPLQAGGVFENGIPGYRFATYQRVEVVSIDEPGRRARVRLVNHVAEPFPWEVEVSRIFGGVAVDGGGFAVIGRRIVKIPPRGPIRELVDHVLAAHAGADIGDINLRSAVRVAALEQVIATAAMALQAEDPMRSPSRHQRLQRGPKDVEVNETIVMRPPMLGNER